MKPPKTNETNTDAPPKSEDAEGAGNPASAPGIEITTPALAGGDAEVRNVIVDGERLIAVRMTQNVKIDGVTLTAGETYHVPGKIYDALEDMDAIED